MAVRTARLEVCNSTKNPRVVWVEPLGEDYTLLPEEQLEIIAHDDVNQPYFSVVEWPDSTQIYLEDVSGDYEVFQDGLRLQCGHNRQAAIDAGLKL